MMRIVFMGSAELACAPLEAILAAPENEVVCVVTQPDRRRGRSLKVGSCPVRSLASARALPTFAPESIKTAESIERIRSLHPDLIVVVAYGQILPVDVLSIPPQGCINLHTSLLPNYRGAAPIQWAIARGESVTGATIMYMDEGMDTGDIICQRSIAIGPSETAGELHDRLSGVGADLLTETMASIRAGSVSRMPQDNSLATYAPLLKNKDGRIDWQGCAVDMSNRVRGFNPWPSCFCEVPSSPAGDGRTSLLKVHRASYEDGEGTPGEVLAVQGDGPLVACGEGALRMLEVQPEGRRRMDGAAYIRGHRLAVGQRFL